MDLQVGGRRVYAYTGGKPFDAARPCVVFLHGALHDHSVWNLLARWTAHHGHAVLAPDEPGHGRSEGEPLASVEALADWTLALLESAGVAQATLVGHSLGSLIALEAAARAPQRVTRLVMIGTTFPMKVSDALLSTARSEPLQAIEMVNAFSISTVAAKPSYPGPGMWLHGSNRVLMQRLQARNPGLNLFERDFLLCDRYAHGLEAAAQIRCPVHCVLGTRDQMTQARTSEAFVAALRAHVHRLDAGHSLMAEQPDGVLAALRQALEEAPR